MTLISIYKVKVTGKYIFSMKILWFIIKMICHPSLKFKPRIICILLFKMRCYLKGNDGLVDGNKYGLFLA